MYAWRVYNYLRYIVDIVSPVERPTFLDFPRTVLWYLSFASEERDRHGARLSGDAFNINWSAALFLRGILMEIILFPR